MPPNILPLMMQRFGVLPSMSVPAGQKFRQYLNSTRGCFEAPTSREGEVWDIAFSQAS